MLVCSVSMRPARRAIAADVAEAATALDASTIGTLIFATLVDDPASVDDFVDAFTGEIMLEAASASDAFSLVNIYDAAVNETASPSDTSDASIPPAFTTWNPADLSGVALSGGNLVATATAATGGARSTGSKSSGSKNYWEQTYSVINSNGLDVGIAPASFNLTGGSFLGCAMVTRLGSIFINGSNVGSIGTVGVGNVVCIAADFTAQLIWFRLGAAGNWNGSGTANPATGTGGFSFSALGSVAQFALVLIGATGDAVTANFGASSFTGAVPSGFTAGF